jgi:acyl dehydratase
VYDPQTHCRNMRGMETPMGREIPLQIISSLVGQELGCSGWHEINQSQIDDFAKATGDHQWMHVDVERATSEMGGTIAHGLLTLSILPALSEQIYHVSGYVGGFSYGYDKVRFIKPIKSGSRVRLRLTLSTVAPRNDGVMVTVACAVEIDGDASPAMVADWRSLYFPNSPKPGH